MHHGIVVKFIAADKWYKRAMWELQEPYISHNQEIKVPAGFITDGASIPFFARMFFLPTGRYFTAAIVHDYIIIYDHDWDKANAQFAYELKALGIAKWRQTFMIWSVKSWGTYLGLIKKNSIND